MAIATGNLSYMRYCASINCGDTCAWLKEHCLSYNRFNNPQTTADANWTPLLNTPSVSGHSTFGSAADVVLTALLGNDVSFTTLADPCLNLAPRSFNSFTQAAEKAGMSRFYAGSHCLSVN